MKFQLFEEDCFVTHCEDVEYDQGKYISYIATNPFGEFHTVTGISFFNEVVPTPTITAGAECQVNQAAQGEEVVTYEEVFKVKYAGAFTHRLEVAPNVEAQYARHGQQDDCEGADFDGFSRDHSVNSLTIQTMFSNTAITVESAAKSMNKKNKVPQK